MPPQSGSATHLPLLHRGPPGAALAVAAVAPAAAVALLLRNGRPLEAVGADGDAGWQVVAWWGRGGGGGVPGRSVASRGAGSAGCAAAITMPIRRRRGRGLTRGGAGRGTAIHVHVARGGGGVLIPH